SGYCRSTVFFFIVTPWNISGMSAEMLFVHHAILRIFITYDDREYDANVVGRISIPSKERDSLNFGSPPRNGSLSLNFLSSSVSARKAAKDAALSYKTSLKAYDLLRRVLVEDLARTDNILQGELEADESYFGGRRKGKRGRGAGHKTLVFWNPGAGW
ncbi:MAG: hypothetical protein WCB46_09885, partial [Methanoregula sp.]